MKNEGQKHSGFSPLIHNVTGQHSSPLQSSPGGPNGKTPQDPEEQHSLCVNIGKQHFLRVNIQKQQYLDVQHFLYEQDQGDQCRSPGFFLKIQILIFMTFLNFVTFQFW